MHGDEIIRFKWAKTLASLDAHLTTDASAFATSTVEDTDKGYFDTMLHMRGTIESVTLMCGRQTAPVTVDVVFLKSTDSGTTLADNDYIDHVAFAAADFIPTNDTGEPMCATINDLNIPYWDAANTGKFHVRIYNSYNGTATYDNLEIGLSWRPRIT